MPMKIFAVYGSSKSGKTTTVVEILKELRVRGYSVSTIKNVHVEHLVFDVVGKDTWRHWKAGAEVVGLRAPDESILMIKRPVMLDELIRHFSSDYLVLEGFRGASLPKILCATDEERVEDELQSNVFCISGLVSAHLSTYKGVPVINALLNASALVDLVERKSLKL
ncbi:MAG: molybdopterin-guanine dinucleotide biosynthesis protein B [Halobacteriota archaeon]|jgi:molybdopterin-guanine dinucleotide biosynthesis protein B